MRRRGRGIETWEENKQSEEEEIKRGKGSKEEGEKKWRGRELKKKKIRKLK